MKKQDYKYAEIVVNRPIEGPFSYSIPEKLRDMIRPGVSCEVSFGSKIVMGYVVRLSSKCEIENIKPARLTGYQYPSHLVPGH